jgi:hypothetical protein
VSCMYIAPTAFLFFNLKSACNLSSSLCAFEEEP